MSSNSTGNSNEETSAIPKDGDVKPFVASPDLQLEDDVDLTVQPRLSVNATNAESSPVAAPEHREESPVLHLCVLHSSPKAASMDVTGSTPSISEVETSAAFAPSNVCRPMLTREQILRHSALSSYQTKRGFPNTTVNAGSPENVEALIDDIECKGVGGTFSDPGDYTRAAGYLQLFGFSRGVIHEILQDISHEERVSLAFLEAGRIQQQAAIDGVPEVPSPSNSYEIKTLTFGPSTPKIKTTLRVHLNPSDSAPDEDVLRSEVHDDAYAEISFEQNPEAQSSAVTPTVASTAQPDAPATESATPTTKPSALKNKLPDDVIPISNAHFPQDKAGTVYQRHLEKWVPDIKKQPQHTVYDLFGELQGELVDLIFYINRAGNSCYIGDDYRPKGRRRLTWTSSVLGPLPAKKARLLLKVISISARGLSEGGSNA